MPVVGQFPKNFSLSLLNGQNGFELDGVTANDNSGYSVAAAGDVNGDGIGDLLIEASGAANGGKDYVVFGKTSWSSPFLLSSLDGFNGFELDGATSSAISAAGD